MTYSEGNFYIRTDNIKTWYNIFKINEECGGCVVLYDVLQEKRDVILKIADEQGIQNVQIFGSVARLEDGSASDLDLLVEFEKGRSLFDLIRFKQEVEDLLDVKVDVVTENSIHWSMRDKVLNGAIQL
ncbi:nucleotidyltransferase family protein [Lentibacillus sp. CBA3610]|uniref:nucleotidyltransferase family protein n=1 Tax=Lentibacillus sp. CBA3610 TaxID=2518176 RepID=UPI001C3E9570|nr:nucleotidyltransferase family protein [Lentibacillus sp. CBA3610]